MTTQTRKSQGHECFIFYDPQHSSSYLAGLGEPWNRPVIRRSIGVEEALRQKLKAISLGMKHKKT